MITRLRDPCEIAIHALIAVRRVMARISLQCHALGDVHPQMMLRLHVESLPFDQTPSVACTTASTPFALPLRHVSVLDPAHQQGLTSGDQSVHVHGCTEAVSMSPSQLHDKRQDVLGFSRRELESWPMLAFVAS